MVRRTHHRAAFAAPIKENTMIRTFAAALAAFALASFGVFAQSSTSGAGTSDTTAKTTTQSDTGGTKAAKKHKKSKKASKKGAAKSDTSSSTGSSATTK
jgi:hypothetical protein